MSSLDSSEQLKDWLLVVLLDAFDRDLITLDDRYRVVASSRVPHTPTNGQWLYAFDGRKIALPGSDESTWPNLDFIHYHNDCVFERCT
ncbi:hypothetical protein E0L17_08990 [Olsenella sp. SW781]|uniref:hypothetical protein n=1 Tax=Olsenella sp. SW781 TaxID=2530046 RepID=UPI00143B32D9|nr:hypothetical protein [Olsenella sp. SW781]NJE81452.1 hypothetical protein [Olsenella sp. SW781]